MGFVNPWLTDNSDDTYTLNTAAKRRAAAVKPTETLHPFLADDIASVPAMKALLVSDRLR